MRRAPEGERINGNTLATRRTRRPWQPRFNASGASGFGDYLVKRGEEVSEALLSVTDARAETSQRPTILKAYRAVRGSAAKHVVAALPNVGSLVQKYAA